MVKEFWKFLCGSSRLVRGTFGLGLGLGVGVGVGVGAGVGVRVGVGVPELDELVPEGTRAALGRRGRRLLRVRVRLGLGLGLGLGLA